MSSTMQKLIFLFISAVFLATTYSCSLFGGGSDEPSEVQLTVTVEPENSGDVNILSRTFLEGDSVNLAATPRNGFSFSEWTGSRPSSANPYNFVIQSDTELTANFLASSSNYTVNFMVSDDSHTQQLLFGLKEQGTEGFDNGLDLESPPPPPQDALHAYFVNGSLDLLHDLRNAETAAANWQLALQPSLSDSLTFSWNINSIVLNGTLTFSIPDISEEIDMTAVSEIKIHRDETNNLSVEYVLGL